MSEKEINFDVMCGEVRTHLKPFPSHSRLYSHWRNLMDAEIILLKKFILYAD